MWLLLVGRECFLDGINGVLQVVNLLFDVYCLLVIENYNRRFFP